MREGWTYQNFEKCIEKVKYTTKIASSDFHLGSKYPIISQEEDYISGYWDKEEDVFHITKPVVIFGDHTRVLKYVDMDFVLGADGVKILQPIDNLNAKFLKYYLQAYQIPNLGYSRHYKILKDIDVPIPPLTIQQQIVSELDLLSHILDQKRQQLKEYDALAESIFYDMFGDPVENPKGWEVKKLEDLCEHITKGTTPSSIGFSFIEEGVNFLKVESFTKDGEVQWDKITHISEECNEAMSRSKLENDDLLICIAGATVGRMAKVPKEVLPANTNQAFGIIRLKEKEKSTIAYLYSLLKSDFTNLIVNDLKAGVAQPNLSLAQIRSFQIPFPPLTLQRSFAAKIESIEHQKQLLRASIKETEMLFQSRMDYWFNS